MFTRLGACRRGTQRDAGVTTGRPYKVIDPFYGGPLDRLEEVTVRLEREPQVSVPELLRDVERVLARRDQQTRTLVPEVVPSDRARDAGRDLRLTENGENVPVLAFTPDAVRRLTPAVTDIIGAWPRLVPGDLRGLELPLPLKTHHRLQQHGPERTAQRRPFKQ